MLSYGQPNYVRTLALVDMLRECADIELYEARNSTKGILRYIQTLWRLLICRLKHNPDVYILGFRGYEVFLPVRILTVGKPLIFDEFINLYDWTVLEHKKFKPNSMLALLVKWYSKLTLRLSRKVLTDTKLNAKFSSKTHSLPAEKFATIYVGTDEKTFQPVKTKSPNEALEVFFYGTMLLLHGVEVILDAAKELKADDVHFTIIGGKGTKYEALIKSRIAADELDNIAYKNWANYEDLPGYIEKADVCLGGPFGDTSQSQKVITGKTFQFLAMAKPTLIGAIKEDVGFSDKNNCLVVDQGSVQQLAAKLKWATQNKNQLPEIGKSGRQLYEKTFSSAAQKQQLDDIVHSVI